MIGYVRGVVTHIFLDSCYVDVHGVGYRVYVGGATRQQLEIGKESLLFTYTNVREDAIQLYGFGTEEEYDLFIMLISVSGIGPKVGLGILSGMDPTSIKLAILNGQTTTLVKLPGIGKKSAERLVLELKDKIAKLPSMSNQPSSVGTVEIMPQGVEAEVLMALQGLGYSEAEVRPVLEALNDGQKEVSELLRATLAELGKGR